MKISTGGQNLSQPSYIVRMAPYVPMGSNWAKSATVVSDRTPGGNDMTVNGSAAIGATDTAFVAGTSDYLQFDSAIAVTGSVTVSFDFKVTDVTTTQVLCYLSAGADYVVIGIYQSKLLASAANSTAGSKASATTLVNNTWYTVTIKKLSGGAVTIDNLYLNGNDDSAAAGASLAGANPGYILGGSYSGAAYGTGMTGNLRNFARWTGGISDAKIKLWADKHYLNKI